MRIHIDEAVPGAADLFSRLGDVTPFPGRVLDPAALADADALIVRSVTRVDAGLLAGSRVRFVGSATAGTDHVDTDWLARRKIAFAAAPGANARPVAEYVLAAILLLARRHGFDPREKTLGVLGVGRAGSIVADWAASLGMTVLRCDPPRQAAGDPGPWVSPAELAARSDLVTVHVSLTDAGPHATRDLLSAEWFAALKPGAILINTARGEVVDEAALIGALQSGRLAGAVLDVWRNEPRPAAELVERCDLATPHLAGHSREAKRRAAAIVFTALAAWIDPERDAAADLRAAGFPVVSPARGSAGLSAAETDPWHGHPPRGPHRPEAGATPAHGAHGLEARATPARGTSGGGADASIGRSGLPADLAAAADALCAVCNLADIDARLRRAVAAGTLPAAFDAIRAAFGERREWG
ncbi:MAG: NAD(P)-dependent oxidoreductase [Phycisphaerae bacterium]